jgi:hypothetical protein
MTADHNAAAREIALLRPATLCSSRQGVEIHTTPELWDTVALALDRARQEGRREGLEEAAKVSAAFFDRWYRDHNGPFDAGVLAASAYVASEIRKLPLSAQPEEG